MDGGPGLERLSRLPARARLPLSDESERTLPSSAHLHTALEREASPPTIDKCQWLLRLCRDHGIDGGCLAPLYGSNDATTGDGGKLW